MVGLLDLFSSSPISFQKQSNVEPGALARVFAFRDFVNWRITISWHRRDYDDVSAAPTGLGAPVTPTQHSRAGLSICRAYGALSSLRSPLPLIRLWASGAPEPNTRPGAAGSTFSSLHV